jgi:hypothetical protein
MKKSQKTLRTLAAAALAFALALTGVAPVWASTVTEPTLPPVVGAEGIDPAVYITKELKMPEGTPTPANAAFEFTFTKYGIGSGGVNTGSMPTVGPITITLTGGETGATSDYITTISKEGRITFPDVTSLSVGTYIYDVTESAPQYDATGKTVYKATSQAKYQLYFTVAQGQSAKYIQYVTVQKVTADNGDALDEQEKVDPSQGKGGLKFINTYAVAFDGGTTTPDPKTAAYQSVSVKADIVNADFETITGNQYFPVRVTLANPDLGIAGIPTEYRAYVLNTAGNQVVNSNSNNETTGNGALSDTDVLTSNKYYTFTVGTPAIVRIQNGQSLVFTNLPVGAEWAAVELLSATQPTGLSNYAARAVITVNGTQLDSMPSGNKGENVDTTVRLVGENATGALFQNSTEDILPLGLDINNLPYYGLILLALLALSAYVAVKARRRRQENAYDFESYN